MESYSVRFRKEYFHRLVQGPRLKCDKDTIMHNTDREIFSNHGYPGCGLTSSVGRWLHRLYCLTWCALTKPEAFSFDIGKVPPRSESNCQTL